MIKQFVLNQKVLTLLILAVLIFACVIALTQELETHPKESKEEGKKENKDNKEAAAAGEAEKSPIVRVPEKPMRWFRSNAGGMALEEMGSRFTAIRNEYALSIDYSPYHDIPDVILSYNKSDFTTEIRTLYKKTEIIRTQWIFRDKNGTTRLNAVFIERKKEEVKAQETENKEQGAENKEQLTENIEQGAENKEQGAENKEQRTVNREQRTENKEQRTVNREQRTENKEQAEDSSQMTEEKPAEEKPVEKKPAREPNSPLIGFIEIFDEKGFLTSETKLYEDGSKDRIDYSAKDNMIITAAVFTWDKEKKEISAAYTDHYRYNRSLSLRGVEREFLKDMKPDEEFLLISFPRRLMETVNEPFFKSQRENVVPEFFGDVFVKTDSKIVFESDDRGRIISQTLYDENDDIVWVIKNTWLNDRITTTTKTEGENEFTARFEYNAGGDKIVERNYKNGVLERVVKTEGKFDIEELYFNNILILKATWEDGRKINEERVR